MSENKKIFLKWWIVAAAVYLVLAAVISYLYGIEFLMPANDDSAHHIKLAENLIKYKNFSLDGLYSAEEPKQPLAPTNFLMPGYALWLALVYLIFKSFMPAIFVGALIFAISVPLTYFLAKEIVGNNKIAFWSALIFMIEPLSVYHSGLLFTEQIFVPIFLSAVYFFIRYFKTGDKNFIFGSFVMFSLSALIRSTIFYFLPILILIVIIKELKTSLKQALIFGLISLFLAYSIIGIWIGRNKVVLNTWQISSNQGAILFGYHYEPLMRNLGIKPENQKIIGGTNDIFSVEYNNAIGKFATHEISKYKFAYLKTRLGYLPLFFISSGYDNVFSRLTNAAGFDKYFRWDLVSKFLRGDVGGGVKYIFSAPKSIALFLIGSAFWLLILILAAIGFFRLIKKNINKSTVIFVGAIIAYFALITTPLITARYRLPINPLIFIFAVSGFYFLKDRLKQWI